MELYKAGRAQAAQDHTEYMGMKYKTDTELSQKYSIVYRGNLKRVSPKIVVDPIGCNAAVEKYSDETATTLLNFASYRFPGGGFIKGSIAQEEAICHGSNLYNVIGCEKMLKEYEYNRSQIKEPLDSIYENFAIFSPSIVFEANGNAVRCNVITCPAPYRRRVLEEARAAGESETVLEAYDAAIHAAMDDRIEYILDICEEQHQKTLILGAFGCGVFGNDGDYVARSFKRCIEKNNYHFENVVFAIPYGPNYDAFRKVFSYEAKS